MSRRGTFTEAPRHDPSAQPMGKSPASDDGERGASLRAVAGQAVKRRALGARMTALLAFGLRVRPVRRLLGRFRWPRPEHLRRMTRDQKLGYIRAIGLEADADAAQDLR